MVYVSPAWDRVKRFGPPFSRVKTSSPCVQTTPKNFCTPFPSAWPKPFKPIFHCEAEYLASGVGVGQLALGSAPRILHWGYQHVGILEPTQTLASGVICVTPNANPRRQSVEYRWRWVPNANFLRWPCTFQFFGVHFICVG